MNFAVRFADKKLRFAIREDGSIHAPHNAENRNIDISDGEWHHFAAVRDAQGKIDLYVDGTNEGSKKSIFWHTGDGSITSNIRCLGLEYSRNQKNPKQADYWILQGSIDEICIFNRALSAAEITRLAGRD